MTANKRPKGGPWYQRKSDGLWCAPIELGTVNGVRKRYVVTAATEAQVKKKYREAVLKKDAGTLITARSITLSSWMDTWFDEVRKKKIKPRTAAGYRSKIKYIKDAIGHVRLDKLSPDDVAALEDHIVDTLQLSSTSALQAYWILAGALKHAVRRGKIASNPASNVDPPSKAAGEITILTPLDAFQALTIAASERLGSRWAAAFYTGARQGELLGLTLDRIIPYIDEDGDEQWELDLSWQLQRISWEHGCVDGACGRKRGTDCPQRTYIFPPDWEHKHLEGGLYLARPKSEAGKRRIPLVEPLREVILRRAEAARVEPNPHGLLWTADRKYSKGGRADDRKLLELDGSPIDPSRDNAAWHDLLVRAGVNSAPLHAARHTTASLLLIAGVSETIIKKILGHSTFVMSQRYMNVDRKQMADGMKALSAQMPSAQQNESSSN